MSVVTITVSQTEMWNSVRWQTMKVPANYEYTNTVKSDGEDYVQQISIMQPL